MKINVIYLKRNVYRGFKYIWHCISTLIRAWYISTNSSCLRNLEGPPWLVSYSVDWCVSHLKEHPGWGPTVCQAFDGPASLLFSYPCWSVGGERLWWWLHPLRVTQPYHLVSMAAQLSSIGISHHNLFPHIPSIRLSAVNISSHPGIAPQSLNSSSQPLGHLRYVWLWQGLILNQRVNFSFILP